MKVKLYVIAAALLIIGAATFGLLFNAGSSKTISENSVPVSQINSSESPTAENAKTLVAAPQALDYQIRHLPLSFEINQGQAAEEFDFVSRNAGRALFLAPDKAVIAFSSTPASRQKNKTIANESAKTEHLQINLLDARADAEPEGINQTSAKSNYLVGNDSEAWRTAVAHYSKARFAEVYPGIDVVYYGNQERLEYDFVVKPGARPDSIRLKFEGAKSLQIDETGSLVARLGSKEVRQHAPIIYQEINGARKPVAGEFVLRSSREVGFRIGEYDETQTLVIDPILVYSTYLGGEGGGLFSNESGNAIALDQNGNVYLAGTTPSAGFPVRNPVQTNLGGALDCFVSKLNSNGTDLIYSTYLGGNDTDTCLGLDVDAAGIT